jgi:hypothetical protein
MAAASKWQLGKKMAAEARQRRGVGYQTGTAKMLLFLGQPSSKFCKNIRQENEHS